MLHNNKFRSVLFFTIINNEGHYVQYCFILSLSCATCSPIVFVPGVIYPHSITRKLNYKLQCFIFNVVKYKVPLNSDSKKIRNPEYFPFPHPWILLDP